MIGMVGIAIDITTVLTSDSQAQAAADAAALAAAAQLDGTKLAIERAVNAAQASPLILNHQTFLTDDGTPGVQIADICFLTDLPPDTEAVDPTTCHSASSLQGASPPVAVQDVRFVQVTTETLSGGPIFLAALGDLADVATRATAIAGNTQVVCKFPPLMICNPYEINNGDPFPTEPDDFRDKAYGRTVLAKMQGAGATWLPGNFGLLVPQSLADADPNDNGQGTKRVAEAIAQTEPEACYASAVLLRPGSANAMRMGVNVRFDVYEGMMGTHRTDENYAPASNVTKGWTNKNSCSADPVTPWYSDWYGPTPPSDPDPLAMPYPADTCLLTGGCSGVMGDRLGDGIWDRDRYWRVNHTAPDGTPQPQPVDYDIEATREVESVDYAEMTRWQVYLWEIEQDDALNSIPDNTDKSPPGEQGAPQCSSHIASSNPERRALYLAVLNCKEHAARIANKESVPVETFLKTFLTEAVRKGHEHQIFLELVSIVEPGSDDGVLHDMVQLYRREEPWLSPAN